MHIPLVYNNEIGKVGTNALLDSGAGGLFMSPEKASKLGLEQTQLPHRIKVFNVDGTPNKTAWITKSVTATYAIGTKRLMDTFLISGLGSEEVILGLPWLRKYNPKVDWNSGQTTFPEKRYIKIPCIAGVLDYESPEELIHRVDIRAKLSTSQRLQHDADDAHLTTTTMIPEYLSPYQGQFEDKQAERFPISRSYDHAIELKPEFTPRDCKVYSLTALEQAELDGFLAENLRKGYIWKSKSPMASPFFFVGKKEKGKLRPTQDYRRLNHGTVKNAYPLPLVSDLIDRLNGATVFSKLDLRNGYNNVRIKDGDQWKAAFKTNRGLFEPTVMFFGLMNSLATFQAFMDDVLQDFMAEGWCLVYMDDILIYSQNMEQHRERTIRLLQRLKEQDLYLKPHKCKFDVDEINFLGLVIKPGQIAMDPTKLSGISEWPAPRTVTGVCSFTGFTNFYRKFIGNYSAIAKPLYDLTKKGVPFEWTADCDRAFNTLKQCFQQEPVLRLPDPARAFVVETDALKWATGGVLRQEGPDGELHPCGYISHAFDATERNYEIYDRELFAIVRALQTWRHYLMEGPHPVTILCDHKNLTYFRTAQKLNRRQARWSLILSMFDLRLVHVPGREMVQSDALSRRDDHVQGTDDDNDNVILLPARLFINVVDLDLQAKLQDRLGSDDFHKMTLESLTTRGLPPIKSALSDWEVNDSLIRYKGRIYVPDDVVLRRDITRTIHEGQPFGHPGQFGTLDLVQRDYWWPGMAKFVKDFVDGCAICQQMKINTHPTRVGLQPIVGAQRASLNAIIEETNVYAANLAFNAVAAGPAPLILQGPITVPSLPPRSTSFEPQTPISVPRLGTLSPDVCDADPNSPEFLRAATTYHARIRAAVALARDQHEFCPRHTGTEPVLPRQANPSPVVPKLESSPSPDPIKSEPDSDAPSDLVYPSDSSSRDSSPIYAQSIGVAMASPSPTSEPPDTEPSEPQSQPASTPASSDPFNPFDVNDEPLAPSTVPFLASGQFNPAFVSIRDVARANPGVPLDARAYTNAWASVWDDETISETPEQAERRATVEEVHEFLCALCAEWHTTAPATVRATVARSADYLRLGIYLGIV
ncbi:pro-pol protein, partial [Moniliophthora roreri MCA 2997]